MEEGLAREGPQVGLGADAVVDLRGHGGVIHCVQVYAVCAALNEVAQLPDGVVDTGVVQAGRVVLIAGDHTGELRRQAGRRKRNGAFNLAALDDGHDTGRDRQRDACAAC